ncbi:MAG: choice-of-anchor D domain-containing protein [Saprospiraceae bacterium]
MDRTLEYAPGFISNPTFARDLYIGDFDGDGWPDVIVANTFGQQPLFYRNRGNDTAGDWLGLADESDARFPELNDDEVLFCAVWGGDVNGDTFPDLYFVNYKRVGGDGIAQDYLLINDGTGTFTNESQARLGNLRQSAFGTAGQLYDMDGDGDLDIIKVSTLFSVPPWNDSGVFVLFNDGTGNFENWQNVAPYAPYMFELADFDGNGFVDLYVVDDATDYLIEVSGVVADTALVIQRKDVGVGGFGGNVHLADLNNDGETDVVVSDVDVDIPPCNSARRLNLLFNNAGNLQNLTPEMATNSYDAALLDLNGDGLMDIFSGGCEGYQVLMNVTCELAVTYADLDEDGLPDACDVCPADPDLNCTLPPVFPPVSTDYNIARQWNEMLLASIRRDFARPTVHARNLFHLSAAVWDAWAVYEDCAQPWLLGRTVGEYSSPLEDFARPTDVDAARHQAISYAAYRLLRHRFANSPRAPLLLEAYDTHMNKLGYNTSVTGTNYQSGSAAELGNYIAAQYIAFGMQDGANEINLYGNLDYQPSNPSLVVELPGNPNIIDLNRWQPLTLELFIDQSGNPIPGDTPPFLSPEWGRVAPFALVDSNRTDNDRLGNAYPVYHDPGPPPLHAMDGSGTTDQYQWTFLTTLIWSGHLDAADTVTWDISPAGIGNRTELPTSTADHPSFYNQLEGGTTSPGRTVNPSTGQPYAANPVRRGDYARVLAEFWADGPDSETPPGHWFDLLNYVSDHPALTKRYRGEGEVLGDLEWDVKAYFALGGAMHDAAITAWGIKGWYDYIRPVSAIRALAELGQSSDSLLPNYHPGGLPLVPGYVELIGPDDPLAGGAGQHLNKLKARAWRGHTAINNTDTDEAGVAWIRVENWEPYQRPSFISPPFAGYISGHSTYSRAAAEVLTEFTGDEYFPGGMGTFLAEKDKFLVFEDGPSQDVELQWATYRDAADESGLSRIWGGIHPPADDMPGRHIGLTIGQEAFRHADRHFSAFPTIRVVLDGEELRAGSEVDFGRVQVDSTAAPRRITIYNTGSRPLVFSNDSSAGQFLSGAPVFTADPSELPDALAPGDSMAVTVNFTPNTPWPLQGILTLAGNACNQSYLPITFRGEGLAPELQVRQYGLPAPFSSNDTIRFAAVELDSSGADIHLGVSNFDEGALYFRSQPALRLTGPDAAAFVLDQSELPNPLPALDGRLLPLYFRPLHGGLHEAAIEIVSNNWTDSLMVIHLRAEGLAARMRVSARDSIYASGATYQFEDTQVDSSSSPHIFTIHNDGAAPLRFNGLPGVEVVGFGSEGFDLDQSGLPPAIGVGDSTMFTLVFSPTEVQEYSAALQISTNDRSVPLYELSLQAIGLAEPSAIWSGRSLSTIDAEVFPNPTADQLNLRVTDFSLNGPHGYFIYGPDGRLVKRGDVRLTAGLGRVAVNNLPAGSYLLVIPTGAGLVRERWVKGR